MNNQTWLPFLLVTTKYLDGPSEPELWSWTSASAVPWHAWTIGCWDVQASSWDLAACHCSRVWEDWDVSSADLLTWFSLIATLKQTEQWWPRHLWNTSAKKPMLTVSYSRSRSCTAPSVHSNMHTSTAGSQRSTSPRFCTSNSRSVSEWTLLAPGLWGKIRAMSAETLGRILDPSRLNSSQAHGDGHISGVVHVQLAEDTFCFRHTLCTQLLGT